MPIYQQAAFEQQLAGMEAAGIIKPFDHVTYWINSFVNVNKKQPDMHGKPQLHICLDPSNINLATVREPFYYKTPDAILQKLSQVKMFTTVDFSKTNHHTEPSHRNW